jgi:hypothetical protein
MSVSGTTATLGAGQSVSAPPQNSDVDLPGYRDGIVDLDA